MNIIYQAIVIVIARRPTAPPADRRRRYYADGRAVTSRVDCSSGCMPPACLPSTTTTTTTTSCSRESRHKESKRERERVGAAVAVAVSSSNHLFFQSNVSIINLIETSFALPPSCRCRCSGGCRCWISWHGVLSRWLIFFGCHQQ